MGSKALLEPVSPIIAAKIGKPFGHDTEFWTRMQAVFDAGEVDRRLDPSGSSHSRHRVAPGARPVIRSASAEFGASAG